MKFIIYLLFFSILSHLSAQDSSLIKIAPSSTILTSISSNTTIAIPVEKKNNWFDKISVRGYIQIRYNRIFETNADLKNEQADRSIGNNGGFFIRRARLILSGQVNEHVYFYLQPDFASSASATSLHFAQIRDAYFDVSVDKKREFRVRIGQSKIPFGFENMQSSQNRLPLDRNDALNSALPNERDLGAFVYYAPEKVRALYNTLINEGYKGSGDYGVLGFGAYNGTTANRPEVNNNQHWAARASYPFLLPFNQIIETGIQMYSGKYRLDQSSPNVKLAKDAEYLDERIAGSFVVYPRPFGIQAEYNLGKGPRYNQFKDSVETGDVSGGYITLSYFIKIKKQHLYPFVRYSSYNGSKKFELDARSYIVEEIEGGIEWLPVKNFELTTSWLYSDRRTSDKAKKNNYQFGSFLRIQAQLNF